MKALCNRCRYSWKVRKIQTSNRRCPICRTYDIDYTDWGAPVLPSRHIPHETGSAFIQKRILPKFEKWQRSINGGDYITAKYLMDETIVLREQAKKLHASEDDLKLAHWTWTKLTDATNDAIKRRADQYNSMMIR